MAKPTSPRTLTCMLLLLVSLPLAAAHVDPQEHPLDLFDLGAPSFTTFSTHDGLPAAVMAQVQVDSQGFVWASSAHGLTRFDGSRWVSHGPLAAKGLLGTPMTTHDGTLWAAFRDRGIARFDGTRWHFPANFPAKDVRRLMETRDADGRYHLWALTNGDGLLTQDGNRWAQDPDAAHLPHTLLSIADTHDLLGHERLWVGSGMRGLWYREDDGRWQRFKAPGFNATQIESLLVTHRNGHEQLWISSYGGGLWRLDDSGLRGWTVQSGDVPTNEFYSLAQSSLPHGDFAIWAASRAGLVRVHDGKLRIFDHRYGLPSNVIRDLTVWRSPDGTQVLWLATENGMARAIIGRHTWQTASLLGTRANGVFSVLVDDDDKGGERLWVGAAEDGLGLYENGRWQHFTPANGLPAASVSVIKHAVNTDGTDTLWMGFVGGDLARVRPGPTFDTLRVPWKQDPAQIVLDILGGRFGGNRELWVATRTAGLYRLRDGKWTAMQPDGAPTRWRASDMVQQIDASGHAWLWASSSLGLLRYDGQQVKLFDAAWRLPQRELINIALIAQHGKSVLWIGSTDGLLRVDVTDPEHPRVLPNDLPPPPDPFVYGALRDSKGRIYICTNNGVQQLTPTVHGYASRVFTRRDGMPHDECNANAQFIDAHGRYWVGTLGGLGVYDPANARVDHQAKPLKITGAWIDNAAVATRDVVLKPGEKYLKIQFALLSWIDNDKSEFRSQLIGDESAPSPWTHQDERDFDHLPPGNYTLQIDARDYAGNLSAPIALSIRVLPAWWQTPSARATFALGVVLVFLLFWQWRVRALTTQRRQLESQVSARTAELNAANARLTELSYHDALTGLANRRKLHDALAASAALGDASPWSLVFVDVDHFKNYNDRFGHPAGDEALRVVADVMQACAPDDAVIARYGGEEFACLLRATNHVDASRIAECMRARVEACNVPVPAMETSSSVTISAGVAECVIASVTDTQRLLHDADVALYLAKDAGRNCVRA